MKRKISLLMVLVMALTLSLSGCRRAVGTGSNYLEYDSTYTIGGETTEKFINTTEEPKGNSSITSDTTTADEFRSTDITGIPASLANPNITLASWYDPGSKDGTTAFYWAVEKYQELYGANTIKLITTAGADGYKEKVVAMMAGGDVPECIEIKTQWMPSFATEKIAQPVDGIIDYSTLHYQGLVEATSWKGKHYVACPNGMWSTILWYNKKLFNDWGVKTPMDYYNEGDWTWDNFVKAARDMTRGKVVGFSTQTLDTLLRSQKTEFMAKNANGNITVTMNSPEVTNALQVMYDMVHKYKCWNPDLTFCATNFKKNRIAMSSGTIGFYQSYCDGMSVDDIDCAPLPRPNNSSPYYAAAYGIFWGIGAGCDNLEGASTFMKILAQYENKDYGNRTPLERVLTDTQLKITRELSDSSGILLHLSVWDPFEFWKEFTTKDVPVATIISEYKGIAQKAADTVNK